MKNKLMLLLCDLARTKSDLIVFYKMKYLEKRKHKKTISYLEDKSKRLVQDIVEFMSQDTYIKNKYLQYRVLDITGEYNSQLLFYLSNKVINLYDLITDYAK